MEEFETIAQSLREDDAFNVPTELDMVRETVARLEAELATARNNNLAALNRVRDEHREDIDLIGQTLISEADDRDWCQEYDDVVERINRKLHVTLPLRQRAYVVRIPITVRVSVPAATSDDEAEEIARKAIRSIEYDIDNGEHGPDDLSATCYVEDAYSWETEQDDD